MSIRRAELGNVTQLPGRNGSRRDLLVLAFGTQVKGPTLGQGVINARASERGNNSLELAPQLLWATRVAREPKAESVQRGWGDADRALQS